MSYETELLNKTYVPNIVILFKGQYWSIRQPDFGLDVPANNRVVDQVAINPTKIDPTKIATTINTYNFKLIDKNLVVTSLFNGVTQFFQNEPVEIYIGRCGVNMGFADYFPLPITYVKSVSRDGNAYTFKTTEAKDRLNRPAFGNSNKLEVDILAATTQIDTAAPLDVTKFPSSGMLKLDDEFISYTGLDLVNNRFLNCIRGEENTIPADHAAGNTIYLVNEIIGNPIDLLLQILISSGGGGVYDVLPDGAGISQSLINIARAEEIRDEFYSGFNYRFLVYGIDNILKFIETELLYPNDLRIITDKDALLSFALLNRRIFDVDYPEMGADTIKAQPSYEVNDDDIVNVVNVEYDFDEATQKYLGLVQLQDDASIADFGIRETLKIKMKGVTALFNGLVLATDIAQRFLFRLSYPRPEIGYNTHIDKSLTDLGEKIQLVSANLPSDTGELNFASTVEVVERGINWKTGDVKFKVGFTSFTGIRECYLAPSDTITIVGSQKIITVGAGRGDLYRPKWKMRLYSNLTREYVDTFVNEIAEVSGDVITFLNDWPATLQTSHRIMFADYDDVVEQQKRYCFISDDGLAFNDLKPTYQITY